MPADRQKDTLKTSPANPLDSVKDNTPKTDIVTFLDSQTIRTNPFGQNISGEHFYKRAERISAAIHLITTHVPAEEAVRDQLRKESVRLLDLALELRGTLRAPASESLKKTQSSIRKLISLAQILSVSGYVSVQNAQSLIEALDELGNLLITSQRSALSEAITLSRDELIPRIRTEEAKPRPRPISASQIHPPASVQSVPAVVKDTPALKAAIYVHKDEIGIRAERIMDILRSGNFFGIKDIVSNLPEYSEKMIQRELSVLIARNRVKKMGAKRWSRYALSR